jgi:hypothetical protein
MHHVRTSVPTVCVTVTFSIVIDVASAGDDVAVNASANPNPIVPSLEMIVCIFVPSSLCRQSVSQVVRV